MINVDVAGAILGKDSAVVTGEQALADYTAGLYRQAGMDIAVKQDIYSSDSIPFADNGVPGINFMRFGAPGAAFIHDRRDIIEFISADSLAASTEKYLYFAEKVVNAVVMPTKKSIPQEIVEKVDEYLFKKDEQKDDKKA
jgi:hypothetical protein